MMVKNKNDDNELNEPKISYLKYHLKFLKFMTMYPLDSNCNKIILKIYYIWKVISFIALIVYIISSIMDIYERDNIDIADISTNMLNTALYVGGVIRLSYYTVFGYKIRNFIKAMDELFKSKSDSEIDDNVEMSYYVRISDLGSLTWIINVYLTTQLMSFVPVIFNFGKVLPFNAWYPFDITTSPNYELTYFQQFLSNFVLGSIYPISDMFVVSVCILTAGQFVVVGNNFKNCIYNALITYGVEKTKVKQFSEEFNNNNENKNTIKVTNKYGKIVIYETENEIYEILKHKSFQETLKIEFIKCVRHYQDVLYLCQLIEDFFNPILASILVFSVCYVIFMLYAAVSVNSYSAMSSILYYLISSFLQQFLITYFGQLLTSKCEDVGAWMYEVPWYICDLNFQKSVVLTQIRLGRPIRMTAGKFFILSLQTFLMILRASFSYFTFLRQIENN